MPAEYTYDYAIVRVVPRVERGERINVGVILSCPGWISSRRGSSSTRRALRALDPAVDIDAIRANLDTIPAVCRGGAGGRTDRRAAAARTLPLAGVAPQHDHSAVGRPHRPHDGSGREPGTPDGSRGPSATRGDLSGESAGGVMHCICGAADVCVQPTPPPVPASPPSGYTLAWSDEFNNPARRTRTTGHSRTASSETRSCSGISRRTRALKTACW